jgi:hypothetical protein
MRIVRQLIREFDEPERKVAIISGPFIDLPSTSFTRNSFDADAYRREIAKSFEEDIRRWMQSVPQEELGDYRELIIRGLMASSLSNAGPAAYQASVTFNYHSPKTILFLASEIKIVFQTLEGNVSGRKIVFSSGTLSDMSTIQTIGASIFSHFSKPLREIADTLKVTFDQIFS